MTPMKRDSMVFYDSFYLAIKDLPPEQFKECACALLDYGLLGIEKGNEGISQTVLIMAKPNIDKNNQRWLNAQKSKRYDLYECGESEDETQLKPELKKSKPKSKKASHKSDTKDKKAYTNVNVNDNENVNGNVNVDECRVGCNYSCDADADCQKNKDTHTDTKKSVGEYNNVYLTDSEHNRLFELFGKEKTAELVEFLSRYIKRKPDYKSGCHFEDLRSWVTDAVKRQSFEKKVDNKPNNSFADISLEDIFEKP